MTLDDAIKTAKQSAATTGQQAYVVFEPRAGVDDAAAFHSGDAAALKSVWVNARRIAAVWPDGRVDLVRDQRVAA
jgi:hypothetical protein